MRPLTAATLSSCLLVLSALSCGESDGGNGTGSAAGQASGGAQAGKGGESGAGKGGRATAGAATGTAGSGGNGTGGNGAAGAGTAGSPASGGDSSDGGEPGSGGSDGFVDCDTRKVTCKIAVPECPANEAPSVNGTCYGPCVRVDHCACNTAAECPNQNEYTCWMQQHCGPFVE